MATFVTGGARPLGTHAVFELMTAGHDVFIIDSLRNSKHSVQDRIELMAVTRPDLEQIHVRYRPAVRQLLTDRHLDTIIHFASVKAFDIIDLDDIPALQHCVTENKISRRNGHSRFASSARFRSSSYLPKTNTNRHPKRASGGRSALLLAGSRLTNATP